MWKHSWENKKETERHRQKVKTVKGMIVQDGELVQESEIKGQEKGTENEREERSNVKSTVVHFARRQLQPQLTNPEGPPSSIGTGKAPGIIKRLSSLRSLGKLALTLSLPVSLFS